MKILVGPLLNFLRCLPLGIRRSGSRGGGGGGGGGPMGFVGCYFWVRAVLISGGRACARSGGGRTPRH
jgi:hypothetical protein